MLPLRQWPHSVKVKKRNYYSFVNNAFDIIKRILTGQYKKRIKTMNKNEKKRFKPRLGATLATLFMFVLLQGLGIWQVERLAWKTKLLADVAQRMAQKPQPLPQNPDIAALDYHHVRLTGHYLYDHEFKVRPRVLDGREGYDMVVPFRRVSGGVVMIDRGWASDDVADKISRPGGQITVEGIVHNPKRNYFTPKNDAAHNGWYWPDAAEMGKAAGLADVAPVLVTVSGKTAGVYPVGGQLRVTIPNDHKQYAIFWFGMSGVLLVIYYLSQLRYAGRAEEETDKEKTGT
jgi:surfeit locus 1 family protein